MKEFEAIQIFFIDPSGVARGKTIRGSELESLCRDGRQVAGSILGLDITGEDVEATGLVFEVGDADRRSWPVEGTLLPTPWAGEATGQLMLTNEADPRHVLARAIERLRTSGFTPVLACEIEFFLLRESPGGLLEPASGGRPSSRDRIESYSLQRLDDLAPFFRDVYAAATLQGLPVETLMAEYAPGQFEVTLHHRADALRAVDEAILWKRLLRGVAQKHGLVATFMAKPFEARAGSGLHLHLSLQDADGRNLFEAAAPEGSTLLRQAIAGMRSSMAESFLVFAPNANSYRRFRAGSYAPIAPTWGVNNRTVSLRVPSGPPSSRHIEHRVAGADANLYLAAAIVLTAAAMGIEEGLDPGPPVEGNGYLSGRRELPRTWLDAIERAEESSFLRDALGTGMHRVFLAIKRQEYERFSAQVTELDYAWYLRNA